MWSSIRILIQRLSITIWWINMVDCNIWDSTILYCSNLVPTILIYCIVNTAIWIPYYISAAIVQHTTTRLTQHLFQSLYCVICISIPVVCIMPLFQYSAIVLLGSASLIAAQVTAADQDTFISPHNQFRSTVSPPAVTPLPNVTWSDILATYAQNYANGCPTGISYLLIRHSSIQDNHMFATPNMRYLSCFML